MRPAPAKLFRRLVSTISLTALFAAAGGFTPIAGITPIDATADDTSPPIVLPIPPYIIIPPPPPPPPPIDPDPEPDPDW